MLTPSIAAAATRPAKAKRQTADALAFFTDSALNYSALGPLAAAAYHAGEVGEVLTVFDRIHARGDSYGVYGEEFLAEGRRLAAQAVAARDHGRRVTARHQFLRAAQYINQALFYVLAGNHPTRHQEASVYRLMESCFASAGALMDFGFTRVAIPYGKTTLPGWLLTPAGASTRRPTVILNNGSDGQNIDMYVFGGLDAVERGINALIFEGPGQGSNLFEHGIAFRPDWEKVITPVVDFLRGHPDVDKRRISLVGSSFGGYLVPRAAAFERRLSAVVADPGVTNPFYSWTSTLPKAFLELLDAGRKAEFNGAWSQAKPHLTATERFEVAKRIEIYGKGSFYDQLKLASQFVLDAKVAAQITSPTLVTRPAEETFYPGMSAILYRWLKTHPKQLMDFTVAQGAEFHCEIMAPTVRNDAVLDWIEANEKPVA